MLPRAERLTKPGLFQRTHSLKRSVSASFLSLYVLERNPRSAPNLPLVGFVIGKKVYAKATQRNRAKRRVREAYRLWRLRLTQAPEGQTNNLQQWYSLVWHIRAEVENAPFDEIYRSVDECLTRATAKYGRKGK